MRAIVNSVKTHLINMKSELFGDKREPLSGNMVLHEKVSVLKKEFEDLSFKVNEKLKKHNPLANFGKDDYEPMLMFDSPPECTCDLYLVIHCLDAGQLRSEENQDLLAELASTPYIHLIVSIDHMSSNRLWNQQ